MSLLCKAAGFIMLINHPRISYTMTIFLHHPPYPSSSSFKIANRLTSLCVCACIMYAYVLCMYVCVCMHKIVPTAFHVVVTKTNLRKKWFILTQFKTQATTTRKSWQQERETAGHMTSTVRKQTEMNTGAHLASSLLLSLGPWAHGMVLLGLGISI